MAAQTTQQINAVLHQLESDGLLDDQFTQLQQLQDESNPDFVKEVVELYFEDSASKLQNLAARLQEPAPDFNQIDQLVHQFKGSSASFGARAIAQLCMGLRNAAHQQDAATCRGLLHQLDSVFITLKGRLEQFLQLEALRKQEAMSTFGD
eukprot:jgi/Astpho2/8157/Aster-03089